MHKLISLLFFGVALEIETAGHSIVIIITNVI